MRVQFLEPILRNSSVWWCFGSGDIEPMELTGQPAYPNQGAPGPSEWLFLKKGGRILRCSTNNWSLTSTCSHTLVHATHTHTHTYLTKWVMSGRSEADLHRWSLSRVPGSIRWGSGGKPIKYADSEAQGRIPCVNSLPQWVPLSRWMMGDLFCCCCFETGSHISQAVLKPSTKLRQPWTFLMPQHCLIYAVLEKEPRALGILSILPTRLYSWLFSISYLFKIVMALRFRPAQTLLSADWKTFTLLVHWCWTDWV